MDVSLRDYVDARLVEQEKRWLDRFESTQRAVDSASKQLEDQANRMATKEELVKVDEVVRQLQRAKSNLDGRLFVVVGIVGTVFGVLSALLVAWLTT